MPSAFRARKAADMSLLELRFDYAWIVNSSPALNEIKLSIGGDDARQPNRLCGIDLLLARLGFVGSRTWFGGTVPSLATSCQ
jgi:hypothetical protein